MEHETLIQNFKKIILDSFSEKNKIGKNKTSYILNQIEREALEIVTEFDSMPFDFPKVMNDFIDLARVKKPGYVNQDLLNILIFGASKQFDIDNEKRPGLTLLFDFKLTKRWLFEYGVRKDKITEMSLRNKWLGDTADWIKYESDLEYYRDQTGGIPLNKLMKGPDAEKKFPFLYKFLMQDFSKEIEETELKEIPEPEVSEPIIDDLPF